MIDLILFLGLPFGAACLYFAVLRAVMPSYPAGAALLWTLTNLVGLAAYMHYDSQLWAPRGQEDLPGGPGDANIWGLRAMPILLSFILLDLLWAGLIVLRRRLVGRWWQLLVWAVVVACWVAALGYARTRSYQG